MSYCDDFDFITWLDVERAIKSALMQSKKMLSNIKLESYYNGADIYFKDEKDSVIEWLNDILGARLLSDENGLYVILKAGNERYHIECIQEHDIDYSSEKVSYPLWKDNIYRNQDNDSYPNAWENGPNFVAFHSFKGGVGRTTSMMTYVSAYLKSNDKKDVKVLLIDADLEAPGISFWLPESNKPTVSFIKFLEALQYPAKTTTETIEYFAAELKKTSIDVGGIKRQIFVLPASLHVNEILGMSITPENISRDHKNPWKLSDHIHELGKKLEVDIIFVDLRAGLSELASPLLFDPRVEHFFVTTVAPQSTNGMKYVLENIYNFQKNLKADEYPYSKPSLIFSLLTSQLRRLDYPNAVEVLNSVYPGSNEDGYSSGLDMVEADFNESFMSISSIKEAIDILEKSSLHERATEWAKSRVVTGNAASARSSISGKTKNAQLQSLFDTCKSFQFAEQAMADDMLVTEPVRNLAKHFSSELPNVVSVGAKGAGKTFTFLQVCRTKTWSGFLKKLEQVNFLKHDGYIMPILGSDNVSSTIVQDTYDETINALCKTQHQNNLSGEIKKYLKDSHTDWDVFWEEKFCYSLSDDCKTFVELNEKLISKNTSITFTLDGVEDNFDSPESNDNQREAIKSLLQIPNKLRALQDRRIGYICFVRADYVQSVIKQNVAQYMSRYEAFKLEWTPETFLRLAYWICGKAKVIGADSKHADNLYVNELIIKLEVLWGKKMGRNASKEANTARWVFAALCDLNGKLQARDLVRFLKFSAEGTIGDTSTAWSDRLLNPDAIRRSLMNCSVEKVDEVIKEISILKQWKEILSSKNQEVMVVPFSSEDVGLEPIMLSTFKDLGIIYEDVDRMGERNRFYLPEIYRLGLGFKASAGGRPRVQALLKRNLGGMPF